MAKLTAGAAYDMREMLATGSLSEFFYWGDVVTGTATDFVVDYADETISERLTMTGSFGTYVDGYPTTGTIATISYWLNGSTLLTFEGLSISVPAFTEYVTGDNLEGLFQELLAGNDEILGGLGDDVLLGFDGHDTLRGGRGADELVGGAGDDFLSEGSDVNGPFSNDIYNGGEGYDRVSFFNYDGGLTIDLRLDGVAQNTGVTGQDTLIGIEHVTATYQDDTLIGNDVGNWFWTFSGTDTMSGLGGDDYFTVGLGTKTINGGTGVDTVEIIDLAYTPAYTEAGIVVSLLLQNKAQATGVGSWTLTSIENLSGFYGADRLTGDANANILAGERGDDRLVGNGGNDILAGDATFGLTNGDAGAITFILDPEFEEGGGNDFLDGGEGNDTLNGGLGVDAMYGGTGNDTYVVDNAGDKAIETSDVGGTDLVQSSVSFTIGNNVERLTLTGTAAINGYGNTLANVITGNAGANRLDGRAGADSMSGGEGNDTYVVDDVADKALEASAAGGIDLVQSSVSYTIGNNVERLTLTGTAALNGNGNSLANVLTGNAGANRLDGRAGADSMNGGAGNDIYVVDDIRDKVIESSAAGGTDLVQSSVSYTIGANVERLTLTGTAVANGTGNSLANLLTGNAGANILRGVDGADTLSGAGGNDRLYGGTGLDKLTGGTGADAFYFDTELSASANVDTILDFVAADDSVYLDRTIFAGIAANGGLSAALFHTGTAAHDADDRILYDQATGRIFYDADGLGGAAAVLFARVDAGTALTHADFIAIA